MDKKINIFLPITPYTLAIVENLINSKHIKGQNILLNPHGLAYDKNLWQKVYYAKCGRNVNGNKIQRYINFAYQIITFAVMNFRIRKICRKKFDFYYVDLAHVLTNSIFFTSKKKENCWVIEDGLLNYYKLTLKGKMLDKTWSNFLLRIVGIKTQSFEGDITGIEMDQVKGQYVFFPREAFCPEKSIQIPFQKMDYRPVEGSVLLIGQEPIISLVSSRIYFKALSFVIDDLTSLAEGIDNLYYKEHHHGQKNLAKPFLVDKLDDKLFYITNRSPIHQIVETIKPSVIVSFGSTASLNLRLLSPISVKARVYIIKNSNIPRNEGLEELFKKLGIKVIELPIV